MKWLASSQGTRQKPATAEPNRRARPRDERRRWLAQALVAEGVRPVRVSRRHHHTLLRRPVWHPGALRTCWYATNRARPSPRTAMRAPAGASGCAWRPPRPRRVNLVTGIADAMLDSVPMVVITGQVPTI